VGFILFVVFPDDSSNYSGNS